MTHTTKLRPYKIPSSELLEFGEFSLPEAPAVTVFDRIESIPQQFFRVQRNLTQLENLLSQISVPFGFILFADELTNGYVVQIGIVGEENYPNSVVSAYSNRQTGQNSCNDQAKIVYGRRWLIEESTPSSEILQTVLLAVQKAREHELREKLAVVFSNDGKQGTPFNSHQDAPLMRHVKRELRSPLTEALDTQVARLRFDDHAFSIVQETRLSHTRTAIELALNIPCHRQSEFTKRFPEFEDRSLLVVCDPTQTNQLLHRIIEAMLAKSHRYASETITFSGFARFSNQINPVDLARFSYQTRRPAKVSTEFRRHFKRMSEQVDGDKVPSINANHLGAQQRALLDASGVRQGFLPHQYKPRKPNQP